ncbi:unnamed protein product [Trichogramma brassicae]|uniref:RGS domain-containing protein n=1 Tax=Trichogramma brassicae TaxID=86971 RepID=A0A6H5IYK5_9HYME|nr:unnamed protein product [Trichogramma brassicae]
MEAGSSRLSAAATGGASGGGGGRKPADKFIGCIGKCTSGLTVKDIDRITDSISKCLDDKHGRKIFRRYVVQADRRTDRHCLDLYERISDLINLEISQRNPTENPSVEAVRSAERLSCHVNDILDQLDTLDSMEEIDWAVIDQLQRALDEQSAEGMFDGLKMVNIGLEHHLAKAYKSFRTYARAPCPQTKRC